MIVLGQVLRAKWLVHKFQKYLRVKNFLTFFSNRNFSRAALCIKIGWVAFEREFKYLYFLKKYSSYHGSLVINKNINVFLFKAYNSLMMLYIKSRVFLPVHLNKFKSDH